MGSPPMSPISPELKEKILNEQIGSQVDDDLDADVAETTFGVDGGVETEKIPRHIYSARVTLLKKFILKNKIADLNAQIYIFTIICL